MSAAQASRSHAIARIRGAIIDECLAGRAAPVRDRARSDVVRGNGGAEPRHKRTPSDEEVASELGISWESSRRA